MKTVDKRSYMHLRYMQLEKKGSLILTYLSSSYFIKHYGKACTYTVCGFYCKINKTSPHLLYILTNLLLYVTFKTSK